MTQDVSTTQQALVEMRKSSGLTQEALSRVSGVPVRTLIAIETGQTRNPGLETMRALAAGAGFKLKWVRDE